MIALDDRQTEQYFAEGAVLIPDALDAHAMALALQAYEWSLANPSHSANRYAGGDGVFYQDLANAAALPHYDALIRESAAADWIAALWQKPDVWFMYEQVFLKEGGATRRTPWHQDASYLPVGGGQQAVMWITFDAVDRDHALEFVKSSHRGVLYDGSRFDPNDDTLPLYGDGSMPRLPNIEAERELWNIVGYAALPGDVVVFHPAALHGGAATSPGGRRRTLTLRFFGEDAVYAPRVPAGAAVKAATTRAPGAGQRREPRSVFEALPSTLSAGDPLRHPWFPKLRPV